MKKYYVAAVLLILATSVWSGPGTGVKDALLEAKVLRKELASLDTVFQAKELELRKLKKNPFESVSMFETRLQEKIDDLEKERAKAEDPLMRKLAAILESRYTLPREMVDMVLGPYDAENEQFVVDVKIRNNGVLVDRVRFEAAVPRQEAARFSRIFSVLETEFECSILSPAVDGKSSPVGKYAMRFPGFAQVTIRLAPPPRIAVVPAPAAVPDTGAATAPPSAAAAPASPAASTGAATVPMLTAAAAAAPAPVVQSSVDLLALKATLASSSPGALKTMDPASLGISSLGADQKASLAQSLKKDNAGGYMFINLLLPVGIGSFAQGNVGHGLYQLLSTTLAVAIGLAEEGGGSSTIFILNGIASYLSGLIAPISYQKSYNTAMENLLR
jgi:hypothetical protein